jgi:hypothetical protein
MGEFAIGAMLDKKSKGVGRWCWSVMSPARWKAIRTPRQWPWNGLCWKFAGATSATSTAFPSQAAVSFTSGTRLDQACLIHKACSII